MDNLDSKYIDFIGMYENILPDGFCSYLIKEFDRILESGSGSNRQKNGEGLKIHKEDSFFNLSLKNHGVANFNGDSCSRIVLDSIQECFLKYGEKFDILKTMNLNSISLKMQKTVPGAGYHVWHCEQMSTECSERVLVWAIYLNTLGANAAGETEFLYQKLRIKPKENSMIIWPASYTHTHRGNVVYGDTAKYIITGWFHLD